MTTEEKTLRFRRPFLDNLRSLINYREMLFTWTMREVRSRYRQSALGFTWALIQPVVQMVVITIIFGNFLKVPSDGVPYPVFAYAALLPWTLFAGSISAAVPSILSNMELVTKIYFPREILPLSAILARLVDFLIASLVFVFLLIYFNIPVSFTIIFVPVLLIIQCLLAIGVGLLGAAVSVFLRDISFALPLVMQLWFYATPVIYPISQVPEEWRMLYSLNPMVGVIEGYRAVILEGTWPDFILLGWSTVFALILVFLAYLYFKRLEMAMSDII